MWQLQLTQHCMQMDSPRFLLLQSFNLTARQETVYLRPQTITNTGPKAVKKFVKKNFCPMQNLSICLLGCFYKVTIFCKVSQSF